MQKRDRLILTLCFHVDLSSVYLSFAFFKSKQRSFGSHGIINVIKFALSLSPVSVNKFEIEKRFTKAIITGAFSAADYTSFLYFFFILVLLKLKI